jgi:hypothetical protein
MLSFLREADNENGTPGPLSARRIAAFILIFMAGPLFCLGYRHAEHGWAMFIPGGLCLVLAAILFLFTTMADIKAVAEAAAAFKRRD